MQKIKLLSTGKISKSNIAIFFFLMMCTGFLVSRALLSIGMVGLTVSSLWGVHPREWLKNKWWLLGLVWVGAYAISGVWSANKEDWSAIAQMKLPFVIMPLAFALLPRFSTKQLVFFTITFGLMLVSGAGYGLFHLFRDLDYYIQQYHQAHVMPTPVYGDYICFASCIALYIAWAIYMFPSLPSNGAKWGIGAIIVFLAVYLHILASKSGLVDLYVLLVLLGFRMAFTRNRILGISLIASIPVIFYLAFNFVPTFHQRVKHLDYTFYQFRHGDKSGACGDLARLISYDISTKIIADHPLIGVGAGDMLDEMKVGYTKWYPEVKDDYSKLIPHNQFLTVALGCGVPAALIYLIWTFLPLAAIRKNRESFFLFSAWFILFIQLMIEPYLEGQFGTFVYVFFILLFKMIADAKKAPEQIQNRSAEA